MESCGSGRIGADSQGRRQAPGQVADAGRPGITSSLLALGQQDRAVQAMRGEKARNKVRGRVGPALYSVLEPGEVIVAGVLADAGPRPSLDMLAALAAIGVGIAGTFDLLGSGLTPGARTVLGIVSFTAWLAPAVAAMMRKPVFAAVTQRSLICYRLSRFGHDPVRLLFRAPPDAVHLTDSARRGRLWSAVRYRGPGASKRAVRLSIAWYWRQDLHQVLTALQFAGAAVDVRAGVTALPAAASVNQIQGAAGGL
jgi:hypothetical protein